MDLQAREKFCKPMDERAILSFCFKSTDYYYDLTTTVSHKDFLYPDHELLFVLIGSLVDQGVTTLDLAILVSYAQSSGVLDSLGGVQYLQSISGMEVSDVNFKTYVGRVLESSVKYKTYLKLKQHLKHVEENSSEGKSSEDLIIGIESDMLDMTGAIKNAEEPIELGSSLETFIQERKDSKITMTGISTGYPILDKQIDGLIPGTLTVIAARKKMGKSAFMTNIGEYVAYNLKKPTLYIDTELTFPEWQTRAIAKLSKVKERDVKHGGWSDEQLSRIQKAAKNMADGKFFHKYMPGYSVEKVVALCKKYKLKEDIGLIIFDYIKEPDLSSTDGNRKEHQLLGDITTKLKDLAGILNVPVLTAVQLNRANDIADSDRIARYGDIIAMWGTRTEDERAQGGKECGNYKLRITDTRRGGSTLSEGIGYWFFKEYLDIKEVTPANQYFINNNSEVFTDDGANDSMYSKYNSKTAWQS